MRALRLLPLGAAACAVLATAACTGASGAATGAGGPASSPALAAASGAAVSAPSTPVPTTGPPSPVRTPVTTSSIPRTSAAAATSPLPTTAASTSTAGATVVTVLRPVAHGRPVAGYAVTAGQYPVSCDVATPTPSPAAVDDDILYCSPDAASADACWPAAEAGQVLCLIDLPGHRLVRYAVADRVPSVTAPRTPVPLALGLADGRQCTLRNGGAGSQPVGHPDLYAYYYCSDRSALWAAQRSATGGVDRSSSAWTVLVGPVAGPLRTVRVRTASFVGNAR